MKQLFEIDLFLFDGGAGAGGGAAAGGDGAAGGESAGDTGVDGVDAAPRSNRKPNPLANVRYGKVEGAEEAAPAAEEQDPEKEWDSLRKGKYKAQYDRDVQQTIQARFKNQQDLQGQMDKLSPILQYVAK